MHRTEIRTEDAALKRAAIVSLISTAVFSFAVHGFLFTNEFFSHDSVSYFTYATGTPGFYIGLGRFLIPLYETVKGAVAAPWLIGLLFIFWMSLATLLTTQTFKIKTDSGIVLTAALLCANPALTLTGATYVYCLDEYAFALCLAAAAVWLLRRGGKKHAFLGVLAVMASLAVYQTYFTVAAALCLLAVMQDLAAGKNWKSAFLAGVRYVSLLAAGFFLYYGLWTLICSAAGIAKRRVEESLLGGGNLPALLLDANVSYVRSLFDGSGVLGWLMPAVHVLLTALLLYRLAEVLRSRRIATGNKVLFTVLACLLPTAMNASHVLFSANATGLMTYARELPYLLLVLGREPEAWSLRRRRIALVLLCCVLWQHTVYANQIYMKKELEQNATVSLATRILDRIELLEGYVPGETAVAFAGRLDRNEYLNRGRDEFEDLNGTVGLLSDYAATYNLGRYLTDYLNYPLLWDTETDFDEAAADMPSFPAAGSVRMIGETVVVKLSP